MLATLGAPLWAVVAVAALAACAAPQSPALSPAATSVTVGNTRPPWAAKLGPIDVKDGWGCGAYGSHGSYDAAVVALRNRTADMGGDYAEILSVIKPVANGFCGAESEWTIHAMAYKTTAVDPAAELDPPCSPGYACKGGVCAAVCNPACEGDQVCRKDRTCGPPEANAAPP